MRRGGPTTEEVLTSPMALLDDVDVAARSVESDCIVMLEECGVLMLGWLRRNWGESPEESEC